MSFVDVYIFFLAFYIFLPHFPSLCSSLSLSYYQNKNQEINIDILLLYIFLKLLYIWKMRFLLLRAIKRAIEAKEIICMWTESFFCVLIMSFVVGLMRENNCHRFCSIHSKHTNAKMSFFSFFSLFYYY